MGRGQSKRGRSRTCSSPGEARADGYSVIASTEQWVRDVMGSLSVCGPMPRDARWKRSCSPVAGSNSTKQVTNDNPLLTWSALSCQDALLHTVYFGAALSGR